MKHDSLVAKLEDTDNPLIFVIHLAGIDVDIITIHDGGGKRHIARTDFFSKITNRLIEEGALNTDTECHHGIILNHIDLTWIQIGSIITTAVSTTLNIKTPSFWIFKAKFTKIGRTSENFIRIFFFLFKFGFELGLKFIFSFRYSDVDLTLHISTGVIPLHPHPNKEADEKHCKKRHHDESNGFHKINTIFGLGNTTSFFTFFTSHIGIIFVKRIRCWHTRSERALVEILINITGIRRGHWSF